MKSYKIRTTKDMYEAVNEDNIDDFLKDFEAWLRTSVGLKKIIPTEVLDVTEAGFIWNDDKEAGVLKGINIEIRDK